MSRYSQNLKKTKNLYLIGSGGTSISDVQMIILKYQTTQELELEKVRILFVDCVEGLLKLVNQDKKLRKYLHDYPFTCKNVLIGISFINSNNKWAENNKIAYVNVVEGQINYFAANKNDNLVDYFEEPYEEALRIVKREQAKIATLHVDKMK